MTNTLTKFAISRQREYLADSSAALITRYPEGMISALKKLEYACKIHSGPFSFKYFSQISIFPP